MSVYYDLKIKNQKSNIKQHPPNPLQKGIKVVVLMGGWSRERGISIKSGQAMFNNLSAERYCKRALLINEDKTLKLLPENIFPSTINFEQIENISFLDAFKELKDRGVDVALLALHGSGGEDGVIQGFLETLDIPYTHSGVSGSAVSMDKELSKKLYIANNILTPEFFVAGENFCQKILKENLSFPVVVKPPCQGSSFGVCIINNTDELETVKSGSVLMVEEYIPGREFTCVAFNRSHNAKPEAMPVTEIIPVNSSFFDYESKYTKGASKEITPADIPKNLARKIQCLAVKCHSILKCGGVSRTDFIISGDNEVYVLETNSIPGMTETSILPQEAEAMGISFSEILDMMIEYALKK